MTPATTSSTEPGRHRAATKRAFYSTIAAETALHIICMIVFSYMINHSHTTPDGKVATNLLILLMLYPLVMIIDFGVTIWLGYVWPAMMLWAALAIPLIAMASVIFFVW